MPYLSNAQRRYFHTQTARDNGISPKTVKEFDAASKGLQLPEHVKKKKKKAVRKHKRAVKVAPPELLDQRFSRGKP